MVTALLVVLESLTTAWGAAQVVQMAVRDCGQALELGFAVVAKFALKNAPGGGAAQAQPRHLP